MNGSILLILYKFDAIKHYLCVNDVVIPLSRSNSNSLSVSMDGVGYVQRSCTSDFICPSRRLLLSLMLVNSLQESPTLLLRFPG